LVTQKQGADTPVEQDWGALGQRLPELLRLRTRSADPEQRGTLICPGALPLRAGFFFALFQSSLGPIELAREPEHAGGEEQPGYIAARFALANPSVQAVGRNRGAGFGRQLRGRHRPRQPLQVANRLREISGGERQ